MEQVNLGSKSEEKLVKIRAKLEDVLWEQLIKLLEEYQDVFPCGPTLTWKRWTQNSTNIKSPKRKEQFQLSSKDAK